MTFKIENPRDTYYCKELKVGEEITIDFSDKINERTRNQNALLWKVIHAISVEINGLRATSDDDLKIYCELLEKANVKYEMFQCTKEAYEELRKAFRTTYVVMTRNVKNKELLVVKCFIGSSKFNTKEMNQLIDLAIDEAMKLGLDIEQFERN